MRFLPRQKAFGILSIIAAAKSGLFCFLESEKQKFAHLADHQLAKFLLFAFQYLRSAQHHAGALGKGCVAMSAEALSSKLEFLFQDFIAMLLEFAQQLARKGADAGHGAPGKLDYLLRAHECSPILNE